MRASAKPSMAAPSHAALSNSGGKACMSTTARSRLTRYDTAANGCSARPASQGNFRPWRRPSQATPAPSSAQTLAVVLALKASGTASVAKPSASAP